MKWLYVYSLVQGIILAIIFSIVSLFSNTQTDNILGLLIDSIRSNFLQFLVVQIPNLIVNYLFLLFFAFLLRRIIEFHTRSILKLVLLNTLGFYFGVSILFKTINQSLLSWSLFQRNFTFLIYYPSAEYVAACGVDECDLYTTMILYAPPQDIACSL